MKGDEAMSKIKINAYHTHYEIVGYKIGMFYKLERDLSTRDPITFKYTYYYHYDAELEILYIPRGYDPNILCDWFKVPINYVEECNPKAKATFSIDSPTQDNFQREVIRFLTGKQEFSHFAGASQQVLNIPTRSGKTYCAVTASSILQCRTLVVVHGKTLRDQWVEDILKYTQLSKDNIFVIDGSSKLEKLLKMKKRELTNKYIFLVIHRTLQRTMQDRGMKYLNDVLCHACIGIKIIDEAHKEFRNTLMLDYATDVWKTFYLTATFALSDGRANAVFQKSFNRVIKLSKVNPNKRKHVNVIFILYQTRPTPDDLEFILPRRGFNVHNYMTYEIEKGNLERQLVNFLQLVLEKNQMIEGKILIASSTIASITYFKELLENLYPNKDIYDYYEGHKDDNFRDYDIVCATPQMLGTGITFPGLQLLINMEPTKSDMNSLQLAGRLTEYAPDKYTYYVEFVDKSIPSLKSYVKKKQKMLSTAPSVISVSEIDTTIIR